MVVTRRFHNIASGLLAFALCVGMALPVSAFGADQAGEERVEPVGLEPALLVQLESEVADTAFPAAKKAARRVMQAAKHAAVKERALEWVRREGSETDYCLAVDIAAKRTIVMQRDGDDWKVVKYWICSTGAPESPTLTGVYQVEGRGYSFGDYEGYTCYYYTQYWGPYLFHSIKYEPGTFDVQDGRLGEEVSEGCVRLSIDNAKWIYDNIPWATRVIVYE